MASRRRRSTRRPTRKRSSRLPIIVGVVVVLIAIIFIVERQFAGYFTGRAPLHRVALIPSPSPAGVESPGPLASITPAPSPTPAPSGAPRVAIIIDDCGYSLPRDLVFLKLPVPITMSILPMTPHGKQVAADAVAAGKAVMLHIPMEPMSSTAHPGPGEITTEMTDGQIDTQLNADIASLPPLPGANNHMGSKASSDPRVMRDVIDILKRDDMFFIDSMTAMTSVGATTAHDLGVPTAQRDVFLDDEVNVPYIEGQIRQLEATARKNGEAIAIGHPFPATFQALETMVPQMRAAGFDFVNASTLVK